MELEPPYLFNTRAGKQYVHEMTNKDHVKLLETLWMNFRTIEKLKLNVV